MVSFLGGAQIAPLSAANVAALESRTEGWAAGIQLAALSLRGLSEPEQFISRFAGANRYITDYLVDEVLDRQPAAIRSFLLDTCILDALSGELCDALTGRIDSQDVLETLDRENLFLVELDDSRQWFRYHHLFADVLRARLRATEPERERQLHLRASMWFGAAGSMADAVEHALAAGDYDTACRWVESAGSDMLRAREERLLLHWLRRLPEAAIRRRPTLCAGYAWAELLHGRFESVEPWLARAEAGLEEWFSAAESSEVVVTNDAWAGALAGSIATARAFVAHGKGEFAAAVSNATKALDLRPDDAIDRRAVTGAILATGNFKLGELRAAAVAATEAADLARRAGNHTSRLELEDIQAQVFVAQGRLEAAENVYRRTIAWIERLQPIPRGAATPYVGLAELRRERGDLDGAEDCLAQVRNLGSAAFLPETAYRVLVAEARISTARGAAEVAEERVAEAVLKFPRTLAPGVPPAGAMQARVQLMNGNYAAAFRWLETVAMKAEASPSYAHEFEHLTAARVLVAMHRAGDDANAASRALAVTRLLSEEAKRRGAAASLLECTLIAALASAAAGDELAAVETLGEALSLAEPEGYSRLFLDEGEPMSALLLRVVREHPGGYAEQLLKQQRAIDGSGVAARAIGGGVLPEPLTPREIEILRLVAAGMRNSDVADELVISVATVKRHIANAFGKLAVTRRTEAVARLRELDLL